MNYFYGNMMNNINNINNMNNINFYNNNFAQKNIINNSPISDIKDTSFINSTLQAFASIKCINTWIINLNKNPLINFQNIKLTKELCIIYFIYSIMEHFLILQILY